MSEVRDLQVPSGREPLSAVLRGPGELTLERRPRAPLRPWEVRIRVGLVGVCGTDRALLSGALATRYPLVPGHEFVGEVIEVGDPRDAAWLGRRVCADINNTCLSRRRAAPCRACRLALPHHCQRRDVTGIHEAAGAFAEELVAPAANLFAVPDSVSDLRAMFCEPLAAALAAFERAPVGPGDVVVVLGAGRLGALIAAVARRRGADVLAVGRSPRKLARCLALDCGELVRVDDPALSLRARVDARTEGLGADVVVEA
ncbi:MAG: alcohol dehydrogenase catalytic domain-containing protein, partial [Myxococcales bacterium]|nr:alcohol dehydrogenase catalytic domain-containing protein [Myxococcales bacterium]